MMCIVWKLFSLIIMLLITSVQGPQYLYKASIDGWIKPHKVSATWHEAYYKCRNEGAELVAPLTEELVAEIRAYINESHYTGLYLIDVKAIYVPGEFSSTKGVPLDAMPVADMLERLDREDGDCLGMDHELIRVVSCETRLPYFCYRQRKESDMLTLCGTFDIEYKYSAKTRSCYKYHKQEATWQQAYSMCVDEGGHLVVIKNEEEAEILGAMFQLYAAYIGLQSLRGDGVWTSIHGDPVDTIYNRWYGNAHSTTDSRYQCAFIYSDLVLEPSYCDESRHYVCERDPNNVQFYCTDLDEFRYNPESSTVVE